MVLSSPPTSYCLFWEQVVIAYICLAMYKWNSFLSLQSLTGLPVMHIVFWFNAYSIVKRFSFSSASVERFFFFFFLWRGFWGWQEILFLIILPQHLPPRLAGFGSFSSGYGKHLNALTDINVRSLLMTKQNIFQRKRLSHSSLKCCN